MLGPTLDDAMHHIGVLLPMYGCHGGAGEQQEQEQEQEQEQAQARILPAVMLSPPPPHRLQDKSPLCPTAARCPGQ